MTNGPFEIPSPVNEPVRGYVPGSAERASLESRIRSMASETIDSPMIIGGKEVTSDSTFVQTAPHRHSLELARGFAAEAQHVEQAIAAALKAKAEWAATPLHERAAIFLKAAELMSGSRRDDMNASTMLGQSKTVHQAEIDAACELIDFLRFNVHFADKLYRDQPISGPGIWNRTDYRPLEGFLLAITPFNFTAIGGNLPTSPAIMGNVVIWKPSRTQTLSAHYTMDILREAGLPDGVINLVHGSGRLLSDVAMAHEHFAGLHFTGSAPVLQGLFRKAGENLDRYRSFPRIVGEGGGKDFVLAHPSAQVEPLVVALGRGAFEYQGQKCSAASRAYIPKSLWPRVKEGIQELVASIPMGDAADFSNFMGAVIDQNAFNDHKGAIERARSEGVEVVAGGGTDDSEGWFIEPTVLRTDDPRSHTMVEELFGPILTIYVYDDADWDETLDLVDTTSPFALTGAVFSQDRAAVQEATDRLRNAAGNFYINDKPTGAVVGQQPFGGARMSGTNDKAGSILNLVRWVSPRSIKETFDPPVDWRYPHMG
jgi:1-pyrroline-5-carboxylate dehydrogenase